MAETPTIVIVGGGWHTPKHYSKLQSALEAAGFPVEVPLHPSMNGARPPTAGLLEDTVNLHIQVHRLVDAGKRVVVLAHSYGGQVATNALSHLSIDARKAKDEEGGVSNLIYMTAFAIPEGGSMYGFVKEMGHEALMPIALDFADDKTVLCRDPKTQLIGTDGNEAEVQAYLDTLVLWNGQCMHDTIRNAAWRDIPVAYIQTTADMTVPHDYQKHMVAQIEKDTGKSVKVYELATGHCPNLTATEGVVAAIKEVAQ